MNNLYGWAMSGYLQYGRFKQLKNIDKFEVISVSKNNMVGYILKVDRENPDELHVLHNEYPIAPKKLAIPYDMLSDYCKKIAGKHEIKVGDVKRILTNLDCKTNYVLHYRNLQLYLSLGMKLAKIDSLLKFKQADWMKKYIFRF